MSRWRRHPDWPERLGPFLERYRQRRFRWGRSDCVHFAADWLREATGAEVLPAALPRYRTGDEATQALCTATGTPDLLAAVSAMLPPQPVLAAGRGDLAAVLTPAGPALGLVIGPMVAVRTPTGLAFCPLSHALAAWRI